MNRAEHLSAMREALTSDHGVCLDFGSDREAHLVRGVAYRIRHEEREAARLATDPLQPLPSPLTPLDCLQFRVHDGCLWILPRRSSKPDHLRRADGRPSPNARHVSSADVNTLPDWPAPRNRCGFEFTWSSQTVPRRDAFNSTTRRR